MLFGEVTGTDPADFAVPGHVRGDCAPFPITPKVPGHRDVSGSKGAERMVVLVAT